MSTDVKVVRRSEHRTSSWSGGETTELAIFPPKSQYQACNFAWRISSATVTAATSDFTRLPGYERHLLLLDGRLRLKPADGPETPLEPGQQYVFHGETPIASFGLATDFNLMLAAGWAGCLTHVTLSPGESFHWQPAKALRGHVWEAADGDGDDNADGDGDGDGGTSTSCHALAFCWHGQAEFLLPDDETCQLDAGDLLWVAADKALQLGPHTMVSAGNEQLILVLVTVFN